MLRVSDTKFSVDRGFFTSPFYVTLTTNTAGATIRYTLDGSAPTATTGSVYASPIWVNATTTLRAAAFKTGMLSTDTDTETYIFPTTWSPVHRGHALRLAAGNLGIKHG